MRWVGDKSISHRAVLFAAALGQQTQINNLNPGQDVRATLAAAEKLGARLQMIGEALDVTGLGGLQPFVKDIELHCGNSGTTARLMAGLSAGFGLQCALLGDQSLQQRSMKEVATVLNKRYGEIAHIPVHRSHSILTIHSSKRQVRQTRQVLERASGQVKSALLYAAALDKQPVDIVEPHISRDHTERLFKEHGARFNISTTEERHRVCLMLSPTCFATQIDIPADPSAAMFYCLAAIMLGHPLMCSNLLLNPHRIRHLMVLKNMGHDIKYIVNDNADMFEPKGYFEYQPSTDGRHTERIECRFDAQACVDMVDEIIALSFLCLVSNVDCLFENVAPLRGKECDRVAAISDFAKQVGGRAEVDGHRLYICGDIQHRARLHQIEAASFCKQHEDHRVEMALMAILVGAGIAAAKPPVKVSRADVSDPYFYANLEEMVRDV